MSIATSLTNRLFPSEAVGPFGRRLGRERGARIPVTVVTGFLGAGKTTLVRHFLTTPDGAGTAVIVNEFGEVGLDHLLVRAGGETTVLLGNGCLCCSLRSDLEVTLRELLAERGRGGVPSFERVILETSGLADPGPILKTFAADRGIGAEFHVDVVLTLVDAVAGEAILAAAPEARLQVALADRLAITKTDLVDEDAVARLTARLGALNGRAEIIACRKGIADPAALIAPAPPSARLAGGEASHSDGIESFVLVFERPLPWAVLSQALDVLVALRGTDLLRVKGILAVEGRPGPVVLHAVQHVLHPPVELLAWPDGDHRSRLVFITRGIRREAVEALFSAILGCVG